MFERGNKTNCWTLKRSTLLNPLFERHPELHEETQVSPLGSSQRPSSGGCFRQKERQTHPWRCHSPFIRLLTEFIAFIVLLRHYTGGSRNVKNCFKGKSNFVEGIRTCQFPSKKSENYCSPCHLLSYNRTARLLIQFVWDFWIPYVT